MSIDKKKSWRIFERIAPRYDLANRILSMGIDTKWRKQVVSLIPENQEVSVLDLATGTGDLLLEILRSRPQVKRAIGVDLSPQMLQWAEKKVVKEGIYERCSFRIGDASDLHFKDREWDWATIAFGIRNTDDTLQVLKEIRRVLKNKGKAVVLEFSLPSHPWLRRMYLLYLRYILPFLGFLITGDYSAYRYLNATVESYPYGEEFLELMRKAGYKEVSATPLTFGIATIYVGQR